MPLHTKTIRDAIGALCPDKNNQITNLAVNVEYELNSQGWPDYDQPPISITPLTWDQWMELEPQPWHLTINTAKRPIRIPTVIVAKNYDSIPRKTRKLTAQAVFERDGYICQVSNKKLTKKTASLDHVIPTSKNGKHSWTNLVTMDRELNSIKGSKLLEELGWKLLKAPTEPPSTLCFAPIREATMQDWKHFLIK
jgi:5-methylcytosine-specific restriction endonuclease McrA